jgi:hypothetical protein
MSLLWKYSRNPNPASLRPEEFHHLKTCEDCVLVLWACHGSDSIDDLDQRLKKLGLKAFDRKA